MTPSCSDTRYMFQFIPILLVKGDEIVRPCDRHSNETVTLRKHVTKYKNMRKLMVEFLRKFDNSGIKIAGVNSILITKSTNLQLFFFNFGRCCGDRCEDIFKLTVSALSINREVYGQSYVLVIKHLEFYTSCMGRE